MESYYAAVLCGRVSSLRCDHRIGRGQKKLLVQGFVCQVTGVERIFANKFPTYVLYKSPGLREFGANKVPHP